MSITKLPLQKTAWCTSVMLCQPMEGPPPQYFTGRAVFNAHPHWCQWGGVQPGGLLSSASMARPLICATNAVATSESLLDHLLTSFLSFIVPIAFTALSLAHFDLNIGPLYICNYLLLIDSRKDPLSRQSALCINRGLPLPIQRLPSVIQLQATLAKNSLIGLGRSSVVIWGGDVFCLFVAFNAKGWRSQGRVRFHQRFRFALHR